MLLLLMIVMRVTPRYLHKHVAAHWILKRERCLDSMLKVSCVLPYAIVVESFLHFPIHEGVHQPVMRPDVPTWTFNVVVVWYPFVASGSQKDAKTYSLACTH